MSAAKKNQYAAKTPQDRASALLRVRCRAEQKQRYLRAARGKLSPWILRALDSASS